MLRRVLTFRATALAAMALVCAVPAMASEITGQIALSGSIDYTIDSSGNYNFFAPPAGPVAQSMAVFGAQSQSSANSFSLDNDFNYNGNISPAVFTSTINGRTGTLTLDTITSIENAPGGLDVVLSGTFDQPGYAQELATASFLIQSEYIGNNVNFMMLRGFAQLTPGITPEPRSIVLLGTGLLVLFALAWRRMRGSVTSGSPA